MATVKETIKKLDAAVGVAETLTYTLEGRQIAATLAIAHATALASGMLYDDRPIWDRGF